MTAIRVQYKTILDFSNQKVNKSRVSQALKTAKLYTPGKEEKFSLYYNDIIIGMYIVRLFGTPQGELNVQKWRNFGFYIYEKTANENRLLDIKNNTLFNNQYWSSDSGSIPAINSKDLVNIIVYCNRLNSLKSFL